MVAAIYIDHDRVRVLVTRVAASTSRQFFPWVELHDVENCLWLWVYSNKAKVQSYLDGEGETGKLVSALRMECRTYCQAEKAARLGYSLDDIAWYTPEAIKILLPDCFDFEDWQSFSQQDNSMPRARGIASRGGDRIAAIMDIRSALPKLSQDHYDVLVWTYRMGYTSTLVAQELGITPAGVRKRVIRAVRALQKVLQEHPSEKYEGVNGEREARRPSRPGHRKIMSNSAARAVTSNQWEGS